MSLTPEQYSELVAYLRFEYSGFVTEAEIVAMLQAEEEFSKGSNLKSWQLYQKAVAVPTV